MKDRSRLGGDGENNPGGRKGGKYDSTIQLNVYSAVCVLVVSVVETKEDNQPYNLFQTLSELWVNDSWR